MKAAIYARISDDKVGDAAGVARQEADCRALCEARGWEVAGVYVDNDVSAYSGRKRPRYEAMKDAISAGAVDALVAWHPDRITRAPRELEDLVDLAETTGLTIATVTAGEYDLSTPTGRMVARVVGATAKQESEHKAERVRRKILERAESGGHHGGRRGYGHTMDRQIVPDEAAEIRDAARRVLRGEALRSITLDWNQRGLRTTTGGEWCIGTVGRLLTQPRLAGIAVYRGEPIGKGNWPAILDVETHERLTALSASRRRSSRRGRAPQYLLTGGLAVCRGCGASLRANTHKPSGKAQYVCSAKSDGRTCPQGVAIAIHRADETAREAVFAHIDGPEFALALERAAAREADREGDVASITARLTTERARLVELGDMLADGDLSPAEYKRLTAKVGERIDEQQQLLASIESVGPAAPFVGQGDVLREAWERMTTDERRLVVGAVVERFVVAPKPPGSSGFAPERVQSVWRF